MYGNRNTTPDKWKDCPQPPSDTPSDLQWSWSGPQSHALLCAASWDGTVRVWQVQTQAPLNNQPVQAPASSLMTPQDPVPVIVDIQPKALFNNNSPTLSTAFVQEVIFSGTCDKKVMMHNLSTQQSTQIGAHEAPVHKVFFNEKKSLVCALSWDNSINWWDTRSAQPAASFKAPGMIFTGDMTADVLALLCEDRKVYAYDLNNMAQPAGSFSTESLYYPPYRVKLFSKGVGAVLGGYEGRCRIVHFQPANSGSDFSFRCHRLLSNSYEPIVAPNSNSQFTMIHAVTAIDFNPIYGTLLTAGADGHIIVWDKDARMKVQVSPCFGSPVTSAKFDVSGRMVALGLGYDWSKGVNGRTENFRSNQPIQNKVCVLPMPDAWIRSKPPKKTT